MSTAEAAWKYATKEETRTPGHEPVQVGIPPRNADNSGGVHEGVAQAVAQLQAGKKRDYNEMLQLGVKPHNLRAVVKAAEDYELYHNKPANAAHTRGIWVKGPPGTGKSHFGRAFATTKYHEDPHVMKGNGKEWFDGYEDQKVILMEDLDLGGRSMGHMLKLWSDEYAVQAEVKGGHIWLRHDWFIVTSNFSPEEVFGPDTDK